MRSHDLGEVLFGANHGLWSLSEVVMDSLAKCPPDVRAAVSQHVSLSGGTSLLAGVAPRLRAELDILLGRDEYSSCKGL